MAGKDTLSAHSEAESTDKNSDKRSPRSIRFSETEWQLVEQAADDIGILPATFTRNAALSVAAERKTVASGTLPSGIVELIKRIYLSTYIVSTLKRDEMIHEGRSEELDRTIQAARETQAFILGDDSD